MTFAIASQETDGVRVSVCPSFTMGPSRSGELTAADMWDEIKKVDTSPPIRPSIDPDILFSAEC